MNIEVEKKTLLKAIFLAQTIAEKKTNMPILGNLLFEADNDQLKIYSTNLEISLVTSVSAKVRESGKATMNAKHIFEIIKELNDDWIQIRRLDNSWIQIQQKRYNSKLHGNDPEEYPVFPVVKSCNIIQVDPKILKEMIAKVIFSVSNDDTRYHLNGVYFDSYTKNTNLEIRMAATDGHRLAVVQKHVDKGDSIFGQNNNGIIIPRKGLYEINKILESVENLVELAIEGAQLIIKNKETVLLIRLIAGKYPSYQQLIPQTINHSLLIPREHFLSTIRRVSFHAHQKSKGIQIDVLSGVLKLSSNNTELGDAIDEIEVDYKGEGFSVNLNSRYIMEILDANTSELIEMQIKDVKSPIIIRPHNDGNYTCVVMPMRL